MFLLFCCDGRLIKRKQQRAVQCVASREGRSMIHPFMQRRRLKRYRYRVVKYRSARAKADAPESRLFVCLFWAELVRFISFFVVFLFVCLFLSVLCLAEEPSPVAQWDKPRPTWRRPFHWLQHNTDTAISGYCRLELLRAKNSKPLRLDASFLIGCPRGSPLPLLIVHTHGFYTAPRKAGNRFSIYLWQTLFSLQPEKQNYCSSLCFFRFIVLWFWLSSTLCLTSPWTTLPRRHNRSTIENIYMYIMGKTHVYKRARFPPNVFFRNIETLYLASAFFRLFSLFSSFVFFWFWYVWVYVCMYCVFILECRYSISVTLFLFCRLIPSSSLRVVAGGC